MLRKILAAIRSFIELFVINWPGPVGRGLRYRYYKGKLRHLGRGVVFDAGVQIFSPEWVSIGDNTWIDSYVIIIGGPPKDDHLKVARRPNPSYRGKEGEVHIGRNCHIAPHSLLSGHGGLWIGDNVGVASGARIYSYSHHYCDLSNPNLNDPTIYKLTPMVPPEEQALISAPVVLEDNSAVCLNSVVLPGVTIGENSWLGTCSTLWGSIGSNVIASGVPARPVKKRLLNAPTDQ